MQTGDTQPHKHTYTNTARERSDDYIDKICKGVLPKNSEISQFTLKFGRFD